MIRDETNEIKYPFRLIKSKNKDSEDILNHKKALAMHIFKEYLESVVKDKENYYSKEYKCNTKSCSCILLTMQDDHLPKLCTVIDDLSACILEFRKYYFREVVGSGFTDPFFVKVHNPCTYCSIASEPDFVLCKYILCMILDIGVRIFKGILKSYGSTVKLEYSLKGIKYERLSIKSLK